jgi:hypothetical protein
MTNFKDRIIRAAKLDVNLYEEVEADKRALGQAMGVVVLSSIAAGIGTIARGGLGGVLIGTITAIIPQTKADHGELLRTIGFSSSPGLIRALGFIPGIGAVIFLVGSIWMLVAMVIAVRQALDYKSTLRAVGVCVIGWIIQMLILMLLFSIFGGAPKPV